jgi:hypothetical protein
VAIARPAKRRSDTARSLEIARVQDQASRSSLEPRPISWCERQSAPLAERRLQAEAASSLRLPGPVAACTTSSDVVSREVVIGFAKQSLTPAKPEKSFVADPLVRKRARGTTKALVDGCELSARSRAASRRLAQHLMRWKQVSLPAVRAPTSCAELQLANAPPIPSNAMIVAQPTHV